MPTKPPRCAPGIWIVARSVSGQGSSAALKHGCRLGHGCLPLLEIYLLEPTRLHCADLPSRAQPDLTLLRFLKAMLSGFLTSIPAKPPRCVPGILIVARSVSGQGSSAALTAGGLREAGILRGFQGHRCVPLDEIYLTVPLSPRNSSSRRFDLTEETMHFAS